MVSTGLMQFEDALAGFLLFDVPCPNCASLSPCRCMTSPEDRARAQAQVIASLFRTLSLEVVPLLACPKCGTSDSTMLYLTANDSCQAECTFRGHQEHFRRGCRRCHFSWCTDDVITGRET